MENFSTTPIIQNNSVISLLDYHISEFIESNFLAKNCSNRFTTKRKEIIVKCKKDDLAELLEEELKDCVTIDMNRTRSIIVEYTPSGINYIILTLLDPAISKINIAGSKDFVKRIIALIDSKSKRVDSLVRWYHKVSGKIESIFLEINQINLPVDEMYPWLKVPLTEYYDDFLNSNENILLLIGPPGTGKTTFIKGLVKHNKTVVSLSYDESTLNMDSLFISFFRDIDSNILLIEDADTHIKSRDSGNELMKRFLNVADGIGSPVNKKIIFTTNLPNVREVDPALIRPGRCFDVLQFRKLEVEELNRLAKRLGIDKEVTTSMTLAEFFSYANSKARNRSNVNTTFGFA